MRSWRSLPALLGAAFLATGCGAPGRGFTKASSPPAPTAPAAPWNASGVWGALRHLPNYSYTSTIGDSYNLQSLSLDQDAFFSGSDYHMDVLGADRQYAFLGATSLIYVHGEHYMLVTSPSPDLPKGWYDIGGKLSTPYDSIETEYALLPDTWQERLTNSHGTYAGTCAALGRAGDLFHVSYSIPKDAAIGGHASGDACIDRKTGAPLRLDITLHTEDSQGGLVQFEEHFQLTGLGNVPPVEAPTGPKPAPAVTLLP